ncbi:MAG: hypothetical protein N2447_05625, partial [Thermoanaerobaculum sp.]|nr:hypothetical protein [Thermoanaerobaculum sp.]
VGGVRVSAREGWYRYALEQERWLGVLSASRVVVRKGLLAGVTLGAQYGRFAGEPFWGGEVRWSLYPGGTLLPAVALGAGYSWLANSLVDFGVGEVRLVLSKGFVLLTPYAGLGVRHQRLEAKFGEPVPRWHQTEGSRAVVTAGVVMYPLPLVRLVAEARKGFATTFAVAVGVAL